MSDRILTLHPTGKQGVNIERAKYDAVRDAILDSIRQAGEMRFADLPDAVGQRLPHFEGSVGWYTTTVKLDLEARGLIARVASVSPQRLRLVESSPAAPRGSK